jgi:hypothetical protein
MDSGTATVNDQVRQASAFAYELREAMAGVIVGQEGERYLVTWEPGLFVKESDAVVPTPGTPPEGTTNESRWFEVSLRGGWLLAMVGTTPAYATLVSIGRGGEPVPGRPTLETASTPTGTYTVGIKLFTATMDGPGSDQLHSEVPWVQNFMRPYSLHAAPWHNIFGDRASGGCVNLSPIDARYLFDFSEPRLPLGWHAVKRIPGEASSVVVLHP